MSTELHTHTKPWSREASQSQVSYKLIENQGTSNISNPDLGHVGQPRIELLGLDNPHLNMAFYQKTQRKAGSYALSKPNVGFYIKN